MGASMVCCAENQELRESPFYSILNGLATVKLSSVKQEYMDDIFFRFDTNQNGQLDPEELFSLLLDYFEVQQQIENRFNEKKVQLLKTKRRLPGLDLAELLMDVCKYDDEHDLLGAIQGEDEILLLAFDCLFLSRNPSGIKEQTFLESSVRVLFGAYQIDRSDVKNMMGKTMTKNGDKDIYNDFNEDDLVMDFTPGPHEQIAGANKKKFRTDGNLHRGNTLADGLSDKKSESENQSTLFPNGTFVRVYSESKQSWNLAVIVAAKHDGLVQVRYGQSLKYVRTTDESTFELVKSKLETSFGEGELVEMYHKEYLVKIKLAEFGFVFVNATDVKTEAKASAIELEENLSELYPNGSTCEVFSESEHRWIRGIIVGAKSDEVVHIRYGNKMKWVETKDKGTFRFDGMEEENKATIYVNGSFCKVFSFSSDSWRIAEIVAAKNDDLVQVKYDSSLKWVHTDNPETFRMLEDTVLSQVGAGTIESIDHPRGNATVKLPFGTLYCPLTNLKTIAMDTADVYEMFSRTQVKGILFAKVVQCFELPQTNFIRVPSPYVSLTCPCAEDSVKNFAQTTRYVNKDRNPIFNELLQLQAFHFDPETDYEAEVNVFNHSLTSSDELIGTARLPLPERFDRPYSHVLTLHHDNADDFFGVITISVLMIVAGRSAAKIKTFRKELDGRMLRATNSNGEFIDDKKSSPTSNVSSIRPSSPRRNPETSRYKNFPKSQSISGSVMNLFAGENTKRSADRNFTVSFATSDDDANKHLGVFE